MMSRCRLKGKVSMKFCDCVVRRALPKDHLTTILASWPKFWGSSLHTIVLPPPPKVLREISISLLHFSYIRSSSLWKTLILIHSKPGNSAVDAHVTESSSLSSHCRPIWLSSPTTISVTHVDQRIHQLCPNETSPRIMASLMQSTATSSATPPHADSPTEFIQKHLRDNRVTAPGAHISRPPNHYLIYRMYTALPPGGQDNQWRRLDEEQKQPYVDAQVAASCCTSSSIPVININRDRKERRRGIS
ncbi:hypothetical protein CPB85DRAFT_292045 [Mucidula mucida]|nr:hypothetical protein CPB85DRAFT_292045 [Mucidula mucida]